MKTKARAIVQVVLIMILVIVMSNALFSSRNRCIRKSLRFIRFTTVSGMTHQWMSTTNTNRAEITYVGKNPKLRLSDSWIMENPSPVIWIW